MPFTGGKKCLEKPLVSLKSLIFRGVLRKTNTGGIALKGGGAWTVYKFREGLVKKRRLIPHCML